jgi:TIR domain
VTKKIRSRAGEYDYDVCLSFAGDDRLYVEKVAEKLRKAGVRVFYDRYEQVELWGKDLYAHLSHIYSKAARFCVLFVSARYARRVWTNHERAAAQERAIREHGEYVLPARFDGTNIPGLRRTIGYVDLKRIPPAELAKMITEKLGGRQRTAYLPPMPDLLLRSYVEEFGPVDPGFVQETAEHFLESLRRTNPDEREAIIRLFQHTCPADLPHNVHMNIDLLCRLTGSSEAKLIQTFAGLRSLGFFARSSKRRAEKAHIGEDRIISVEWHDMRCDARRSGNATDVAYQMMNISDFAHCDDCAFASLRRLDFSHLSSSTLTRSAYDLETGRRIPNVGKEIRKLHPMETRARMPLKHKDRGVPKKGARAR